jgi:hypothetical protein
LVFTKRHEDDRHPRHEVSTCPKLRYPSQQGRARRADSLLRSKATVIAKLNIMPDRHIYHVVLAKDKKRVQRCVRDQRYTRMVPIYYTACSGSSDISCITSIESTMTSDEVSNAQSS